MEMIDVVVMVLLVVVLFWHIFLTRQLQKEVAFEKSVGEYWKKESTMNMMYASSLLDKLTTLGVSKEEISKLVPTEEDFEAHEGAMSF